MDIQLLKQMREQGGDSFADAVVLGASGNQVACQVAYDLAWEQLHSGSWDSVAPVWRDAFALSCLHLASSLRSTAQVAEALKYLDLGLIMGGSLLRADLNSAVSFLQSDRGDVGKSVQPSSADGSSGNLHGANTVECALEGDKQGSNSRKFKELNSNLCAEKSDHKSEHLEGYAAVAAEKEPKPTFSCDEGVQDNDGNAVFRICAHLGGEECGDFSVCPELLRPLPRGSLEAETIEIKRLPSMEGFLCDHLLPGTPVVIKDAITHWPALRKWQDMSYLQKVAGSRTVPVEVGTHYLSKNWRQQLMTISELMMRWRDAESSSADCAYLAQHPLFEQIPELREDIAVPDYCSLGGGALQAINAWFGPRGSVTPLHHDPVHNLFAQVVGMKYVRLYPAWVLHELYPHSEQMLRNSSQVDLDHPDDQAFPLAKHLQYVDCLLEAGDLLYVPPRWWHYVRSLTTSFSVSFWWSMDNVLESEQK